MRQIICLIPIFWLLSQISLDATWFAFPIAEIVTGGCGGIMYIITYRKWKKNEIKFINPIYLYCTIIFAVFLDKLCSLIYNVLWNVFT